MLDHSIELVLERPGNFLEPSNTSNCCNLLNVQGRSTNPKGTARKYLEQTKLGGGGRRAAGTVGDVVLECRGP